MNRSSSAIVFVSSRGASETVACKGVEVQASGFGDGSHKIMNQIDNKEIKIEIKR